MSGAGEGATPTRRSKRASTVASTTATVAVQQQKAGRGSFNFKSMINSPTASASPSATSSSSSSTKLANTPVTPSSASSGTKKVVTSPKHVGMTILQKYGCEESNENNNESVVKVEKREVIQPIAPQPVARVAPPTNVVQEHKDIHTLVPPVVFPVVEPFVSPSSLRVEPPPLRASPSPISQASLRGIPPPKKSWKPQPQSHMLLYSPISTKRNVEQYNNSGLPEYKPSKLRNYISAVFAIAIVAIALFLAFQNPTPAELSDEPIQYLSTADVRDLAPEISQLLYRIAKNSAIDCICANSLPVTESAVGLGEIRKSLSTKYKELDFLSAPDLKQATSNYISLITQAVSLSGNLLLQCAHQCDEYNTMNIVGSIDSDTNIDLLLDRYFRVRLEHPPWLPIGCYLRFALYKVIEHYSVEIVVGSVLIFVFWYFLWLWRRKRSIKSRAATVTDKIKQMLRSQAAAALQYPNQYEAWCSIQHLRDTFFDASDKTRDEVWRIIESNIKKDSRISERPRIVAGDSTITWEWTANISQS